MSAPTVLTRAEQDNVRTAIRFLRVSTGADTLAKATHVARATMRRILAGRAVSESVAMRVARLAGVSVDDVLGGKWPPGDVCPHCGAKRATERAAAAE